MATIDGFFGRGLVSAEGRGGAIESPELGEILLVAERVYRLSGGLFDPTIGKVSRLWSFGEGGEVPPADSLEQALGWVGLDRFLNDRRRGPYVLDLGGVAKGYAVELASKKLIGLGFKSAIISAGGDMRLVGKHPDGKPWRIAIRHPRRGDAFVGYLRLQDAAVATSGDYERCFFIDGKRYHHILDPRTGMPGGRSTSVTVVGEEGTLCDALATALFLAGHVEGAGIIEALPGIGAVFVFAEGESVRVTPGLESRFEAAGLE
jgi:thiamine biosynthesis lipoprotein